MSAKDEIANIVRKVEATPGWKIGITGRNHWRITNPSGEAVTASMTPRGNRPLADLRRDLGRLGWQEDAAQVARDEKAVAALAADRKANDRRTEAVLAHAAEINNTTPAEPATNTKELVFISPAPAIATPATNNDTPDLTGYRQELVYVTYDMACEIAANTQCRQRHLYERHAAKLSQAMVRGEWKLNPADSLVFDEHGCLINGQHRVWAMVEGNWGELLKHYPKGIPFMVTYDFPSDLAHIFDTGKSRNASDALTVNKLVGWGTVESAALRLVLNYDQSFKHDKDGKATGVLLWPNWRNIQWTNTELTAAASGPYADLLKHSSLASRMYSRAKITRTAGLVIGYLLERDNPDGGPIGSNQDFFDGVCGDVAMDPRDPRMVLMRFAMRGTSKDYAKQVGLCHLDVTLRHYAYYNLGASRDLPAINPTKPMWPVWKDGMKVIGNELRYDRRDPRSTGMY